MFRVQSGAAGADGQVDTVAHAGPRSLVASLATAGVAAFAASRPHVL